VRQKGGLPGPPPVVPHPESLAAQAAYTEALLPRSGSGPNCFQALGPATGSHIVNKGTPVAPLGQPQCPGEEEEPPGGRPKQMMMPFNCSCRNKI
jgi:hypothetical protein